MRTFSVHGPFGLQFTLQSQVPGTLSVVYDQPNSAVIERTRSEPQHSNSSFSNPFARRTQSELLVNIPASSNNMSEFDDDIPIPTAVAPSPAPTEIIPCELTQPEIVEDIQRQGIKVRDFAYEPMPPTSCAPELFDPLMGWHTYEQTLANPDSDRQAFSGKSLWRLLQMGWICREDEAKRWKEKDGKALKEHESRSIYPWKALKLPQPKKEDLIEVARKRFLDLNSAHLPESIKVTSTKAFRPASPSAQDKKRAAEDDPAAPSQVGGGTSPQLKKRKMSTATPNATPTFPPTFVNGRPPKQFPAGNPSDPTPSPRHSIPAARSQTNSGASLHFKASGVFTRRSGSPSKVNNVSPATPTDFASQARSPCDLAVNSAPS